MIKFGLLTAILDGMNFEEVVDYASLNNIQCLEVACWPSAGGAKRRYAGVCHIDAENLTKEKADEINAYCSNKGVEISSLAYYPNTMDPDPVKRQGYIDHLMALIDASALLSVNMVSTFIGRDQNKTVEENLEMVGEIWNPILAYAKKKGVKIAIENCPMWFTKDEWPGGQNLMTSPANWRKIFSILDSDNLGINYDPSHFIWQQIDYIKPLYEFKDKIFHVHYKDITVFKDKLLDVGVMAYPLEYMAPRIPGRGDIDWKEFIKALVDIGYEGCSVLEIEDKEYEGSLEESKEAIKLSADYIRPILNNALERA